MQYMQRALTHIFKNQENLIKKLDVIDQRLAKSERSNRFRSAEKFPENFHNEL